MVSVNENGDLSRSSALAIVHLITDGFGGYGGIARYNRDFQTAALESGAARRIVCLPRIGDGLVPLPSGLEYLWEAVGGYSRYVAACASAVVREQAIDLISIPASSTLSI